MRVLNNLATPARTFSDGHAGDGGRKEAAPTAQSLSKRTVARADPEAHPGYIEWETYEGNLKSWRKTAALTRSI